MNKIIVIDVANIQFRAIHNYLAIYSGYLLDLLSKKLTDNGLENDIESLKKEYQANRLEFESMYESELKIAKQELESKIRNREIFVAPATYTFMTMISGYISQLKIDLDDVVIMAQDFSSWRKEEEKKYKQQREELRQKSADTIWWNKQYFEFNKLYEKLNESLPYHWIKAWLIEADDIASVCCRYYQKNDIILISSDSDWEQLVYFPNVKIYSPKSKKFKEIKNPTSILLKKIETGDKSDNLTDKVTTEKEREHRRLLVDLINPLPDKIENIIKECLGNISPKNLKLQKIPYRSMRLKFEKIYHLDNIE